MNPVSIGLSVTRVPPVPVKHIQYASYYLRLPELPVNQLVYVSPSLPHLKKGARRDFLEILNNLGVYSDAHFNMTDQIYIFPKTGSYIEFFGAEDSGKVRGPGRDILYMNEANLIDRGIYTQLALRTKETDIYRL